jgi:hypothetical protein
VVRKQFEIFWRPNTLVFPMNFQNCILSFFQCYDVKSAPDKKRLMFYT